MHFFHDELYGDCEELTTRQKVLIGVVVSVCLICAVVIEATCSMF